MDGLVISLVLCTVAEPKFIVFRVCRPMYNFMSCHVPIPVLLSGQRAIREDAPKVGQGHPASQINQRL